MAAKRKSNKAPKNSKGDRLVYSESARPDFHDVVERPQAELPPQQQHLRVQVSRKGRGGKTVTIVNGFQTSTAVLTKLLKQLKGQCGSGGTVKEMSLEIQGDHAQKLLSLLTKQGYNVKISGG